MDADASWLLRCHWGKAGPDAGGKPDYNNNAMSVRRSGVGVGGEAQNVLLRQVTLQVNS